MQSNRLESVLRAASGMLAMSLVGCAPTGVVSPARPTGQANSGLEISHAPARAGMVSFTIRWPGVHTRAAQAIPGAASAVVVFVWSDDSRQKALAVRTFRRDDTTQTRFNGETGRYETTGRLFLPPGDTYVLELRAYDADPKFKEISEPTDAATLGCGEPGTAPAPSPAPSPIATPRTEASPSPKPDPGSPYAVQEGDPAPAPTVTPTEAPSGPPATADCVVAAKLLASGTSVPFAVRPGHATPVRVRLESPNGPEIAGISTRYLNVSGGAVEIQGKNFGSDPGKVRVVLVPAWAGWGQPLELSPASVAPAAIGIKVPANAFSGTLYVFVDGLEAQGSGPASSVALLRRLYVKSDNLKLSESGGPGSSSDKAYAVAGATVSFSVLGEEATPWMSCCYNPGDPNSLPQGLLPLSPSLLRIVATGSTKTDVALDANGKVVFPEKGTWSIVNKAGLEQNLNREILVGTYGSQGLYFARDPWNLNSLVSALVPNTAEQWFEYNTHVSNTAAPIPKAALTTSAGNLALSASDFNWTVSPPDALTVDREGRYAIPTTRRTDVTFTGALKLDPTRQVTGVLKAGLTMAINPGDVFLSQPVSGGTAALTRQQLTLLLTAGNGATTSTDTSCCGQRIPASQAKWAVTDPTLAKVDDAGLLAATSATATGDLSATVELAIEPDVTATASVHVTNNGGVQLEIQ